MSVKWLIVVVVFLGLCLGCFYIVEARHEDQYAKENKELKAEVDRVYSADKIVKEHLMEVLVAVYPEQKDTLVKVIYDTRYDMEQCRKEATAVKAAVKKEDKKEEKKTNG